MFTKFRMKEEKGFTLIELLIVVAIIGILAAIAIPQFGAYRRRGYNAAAQSDLRGIRTTQEAMSTDFQDYGTSQIVDPGLTRGSAGIETTGNTLWLMGGKTTTTSTSTQLSPSVRVAIIADTNATGIARNNYVAVTFHTSGDTFYGTDSEPSRLVRATRTTTTAYVAGEALAQTLGTASTADNLTGIVAPNASGGWVAAN